MTSSSLLLSLLLLLASSAAGLATAARDDDASEHGLTHIHIYLHEILSGPNATTIAVTQSPRGGNATFGRIGVLDLEVRDGSDPKSSELLGRYQGMFAFAGLVSPPSGLLTTVNFVFTAGEHDGSTLAVLGSIPSFEDSFERAVVGGTGAFRMARGYCVTTAVANPTPVSVVYEVDLFVKMDA
ncbi:dirigent protein 1-like [Lolium rigidum]|uniref:dirigent protein 1-like n=1 Tax=Lolium rigidum TaxID=89674 RepID=UPI001F5C6980|nr:dirigent protein 1-like [Lolium rigidum]